MTKFNLNDEHHQLMCDITVCDNMIDPDCQDDIMMAVWPDGTECEITEVHEFTHMSDDFEVISQQKLLERQLENMCQELSNVEEVLNLNHRVDCDCFYR